MKHTLKGVGITTLIFVVAFFIGGLLVTAQIKPTQKPTQDPVINFRLSLPQASTLIYAIRYTTILDAKSANELADLLVNQFNDTTLNKRIAPPEKPKHK